MSPPADQIPTTVPVNQILARTTDVAIAVTAVDAYSTGLVIRLAVRLRTAPQSIRWISQIVTGYVDPNGDPDDRLLLAAEFADRQIATLGARSTSPADQVVPALHPCGGGGRDRAHDLGFWLDALPPAGELTLTCSCPPLQIPPSRLVLDATALRRAGAQATVLWPD